MATISTANFLTLADNIAKTMLDLESAFIANPGATSPTVATITGGQTGASNSIIARVAGLNDIIQERDLAGSANLSASNVTGYMGIVNNAFYGLVAVFMNALETHTAGVSAFIATNSLMVHPEFRAAFNYFATNAANLGLRNVPPSAILPANAFVPAAQTLGSIAVTGAATGTFSPGTAIDLTKYGATQLYLKNTAGSATGGTATSFTVTYTNAAGTAGQSATQALSGALAAGATLAIGSTTGEAVSNIVVNSGGVAADAIAVIVQPVRAVTY